MNLKPYSKAIGAALGALAAGFTAAAADGTITGAEVGVWLAGTVAAAVAAWAAPRNDDSARSRRHRRDQRVVR